METKPLTINLQIIDGNFVYALNEDQTNILDFSVRRGYKQQGRGDKIKFTVDECRQFTSDLVHRYKCHHQLLEALLNATATIKMLYGWEPIEAEKDKARWEGPRKEMPEGFTEISNASGVPPIVMKNVLEGYEKVISLATRSEVANG